MCVGKTIYGDSTSARPWSDEQSFAKFDPTHFEKKQCISAVNLFIVTHTVALCVLRQYVFN